MTRVVAGPFNRVEGDLEVGLDIDDGMIRSASVTATLYRGFEQLMLSRPPADALVIAPRICGICSVSQSIATASALRDLAGGRAAPNGLIAANIAHAAENIADHLTHFYLFFMPDLARDDYAGRPWFDLVRKRFKAVEGNCAADFLPVRRRLLEIMGLFAGKWPHSLAFQPGGTTRAIDVGERVQALSIVGELQLFLERVMFGVPLGEVLSWESPADLEAYLAGPASSSDFAAFLRPAADLGFSSLGLTRNLLLSFGAYHGPDGPLFRTGTFEHGAGFQSFDRHAITEDVTRSWMEASPARPDEAVTTPDAYKADAYSWAKAPRLEGQPAETGALARQAIDGHPLITALLEQDGGASVRTRIVARMIEAAMLTHQMTVWLRELRLKEAFCASFDLPDNGEGTGLVEAARGALGHWLKVEGGKLAGYQIIAPTTWNFSPRDAAGMPGPLEQALVGVNTGDRGAKAVAIQHVVRSFDPCMVCTAH